MNAPDRQEQESFTGPEAIHAAEVMRLQAARDISAADTVALPRPVEEGLEPAHNTPEGSLNYLDRLLLDSGFRVEIEINRVRNGLAYSKLDKAIVNAARGLYANRGNANNILDYLMPKLWHAVEAYMVAKGLPVFPVETTPLAGDKERIAALEGAMREALSSLVWMLSYGGSDNKMDAVIKILSDALAAPAVAPTTDGGAL